MNSKENKNAVVTGGTRGIGLAIAEQLLKDGYNVTITGTKNEAPCIDTAQYQQVDFLDNASLGRFIEYLRNENVSILINNAGINKIGKFEEIENKDYDDIIKINQKVPFLLTQAVLPNMKKIGWGRIVNITSIFGHITKEYRAPYSTSKFGLDGMTAALSAEVAEFGILANCVGPGFIDTELTRTVLGEKGMNELRKRIPIKRLGKPEEVAKLVLWLVSAENTYLTGQNIMIDGGFSRV